MAVSARVESVGRPAHGISVWLASRPDGRHDGCLQYLDHAERRRYARLRYKNDRARFAIGRALTKYALSRTVMGTDPTSWTIAAEPTGKPRVNGPESRVEINIAHADDMIVTAIGRDHPVGVDVERLDAPAQLEPIADVLSDRDRRKLASCAKNEISREFRRLWTIKEAYAKRSGQGVAMDFSKLDFDWQPRKRAQRILTDCGAIETRTIDASTGIYGIAVASESLKEGFLSIRSVRVSRNTKEAA